MRDLFSTVAKTAIIAGAALAVAACGGRQAAVNNAAANDLDANMSFGSPGNDASAMESAANMSSAPAPSTKAGNGAADTEPLPTGTGTGDSGGDQVESNVSGM